MIVKMIPRGGIGLGNQPIVLDIAQIIVYHPNGTPQCCAADYGPDGAIAVSMAGAEDFNRMLRALGEHLTVIVDTLQLPKPPPGARLVAGPRPHE